MLLLSNTETVVPPDSIITPLHLQLYGSLMREVARSCIYAARSLSAAICDDFTSSGQAVPAWWFNVFCKLLILFKQILQIVSYEY